MEQNEAVAPLPTILRGQQVIHTIAAPRGSFGEEVLRLIASADSGVSSSRFTRRFSPWHAYVSGEGGSLDVMESSGVIIHIETNQQLSLALLIGHTKGLILKDGHGSGYSLRYDHTLADPIITIGSVFKDSVARAIAAKQIAQQLVAMVYRGSGWRDRNGNVHEAPFGQVAPPPKHSPLVGRLGRTRKRERERGMLFGGVMGCAWDYR